MRTFLCWHEVVKTKLCELCLPQAKGNAGTIQSQPITVGLVVAKPSTKTPSVKVRVVHMGLSTCHAISCRGH